MIKLICGLGAFAVLAAAPLWAHHSAAAEYDGSKLLILTGTVTRFEWTNPHVHCHLEVRDPNGTTSDWYLEMASPNGMLRQGWRPTALKSGDMVTVEAFAAKDNARLAKTHRMKIPDGRWLYADSSGPDVPTE